jgi:hypothetical protein
MKTFEKNQNPQENQNQDKKQTNQTPGSQINNPDKRPLDPTKREEPVKEPGKQQPYVDPDPTSPEKTRNDPYAGSKETTPKKESHVDTDDENELNIDTNPTGKTKDASINANDSSYKNSQSNTERNANSDVDHEKHDM